MIIHHAHRHRRAEAKRIPKNLPHPNLLIPRERPAVVIRRRGAEHKCRPQHHQAQDGGELQPVERDLVLVERQVGHLFRLKVFDFQFAAASGVAGGAFSFFKIAS